MTAKDVTGFLERKYEKERYLVPNIYFFDHPYQETDFLIVKAGNNYCYDIEIKVSRGDFFADFKKEQKHKILKHGYFTRPHSSYVPGEDGLIEIPANAPIEAKSRPNRFYFCVPEGLISKEEVPDYAGLLYVLENGEIEKVKEAKLLHREALEVEKKLCRKFYFYWKNAI